METEPWLVRVSEPPRQIQPEQALLEVVYTHLESLNTRWFAHLKGDASILHLGSCVETLRSRSRTLQNGSILGKRSHNDFWVHCEHVGRMLCCCCRYLDFFYTYVWIKFLSQFWNQTYETFSAENPTIPFLGKVCRFYFHCFKDLNLYFFGTEPLYLQLFFLPG